MSGEIQPPNTYVPDELDRLILEKYPQPIAVNYQRLLDISDWHLKVDHCLRVFEFTLRMMALQVISQYLIRDAERVNDPYLNRLLLSKLPGQASLGTWQQLFFATLKVYQGKRSLFLMPELYDFYWETVSEPHKPRKGVQESFSSLVQIRNDLVHRFPPSSATEWEAKFRVTHSHLRRVLAQLSFIQRYDLIRILHREGDQYQYMLCKGTDAIIGTRSFTSHQDLEIGWFYLSKGGQEFLQLHPLLVFWEGSRADLTAETSQATVADAAIYDSFTKEAVNYLATVLWRFVSDRRTVADFVRVLYYTLEQVKADKRRVAVVSWLVLKEVSQEISASQTTAAAGKFLEDLYVERLDLPQNLEDFLNSDRNCLVLLGHSGVGKSSFLLSFLHECKGREDICAIFLDGARLESDRPLTETLTQDFRRRLRFLREGVETEIQDLLFEISRLDSISTRKFLLLIDAINENPRSTDLLVRIDTLVRDNPFRWLKVIVSSRPEAWNVANRGIRSLAVDRYYPGDQSQQLGMVLGPFTLKELEEAYQKYKGKFKVDSELADLSGQLRHILTSPLSLKLVMESYQGRQLPTRLGSTQIIQHYLEALCGTKRLSSEDLVFLQQEIVPLMFLDDAYSNAIGAQQINTTLTTDGRRLRELIMSDDVLTGGRRVNSSFVDLADAEILTLRGGPIDYEVAFKFERFYDYFAGQYICKRASQTDRSSRQAYYEHLAEQVPEKVYLLGGIEQSLVLGFLTNQTASSMLFAEVAGKKQAALRDAVGGALVQIGNDFPAEVDIILRDLATTGQETALARAVGSWRSIIDLLGNFRGGHPREWKQDERTRAIVPLVAGQLNLPTRLVQSATDPSFHVREEAANAMYLYWRRMKQAGRLSNAYAPIRALADKAGRGTRAFPNIPALMSLIDTSAQLAVPNLPASYAAVAPLVVIWQGVLARLPFVLPGSHTLRGRASDVVRNRLLLNWVGGRLEKILYLTLSDEHPINVNLLNRWYRLPAADREQWKQFVSYADPESYAIKDIGGQLVELATDERPLFAILTAMIFPSHACVQFDEVIRLIDAIVTTQSVLGLNVALRVLEVMMELFSTDNTRLESIGERATSITLDLWSRPVNVFWEVPDQVICWPMYQECMTSCKESIQFARQLVDNLPALISPEERQDRVRNIIRALGNVSRSAWGFERQALETMSVWFADVDEVVRAEVVSELSKTYLLCPGLVSEFIARSTVAEQLFLAVERGSRVQAAREAALRPGGGVLYSLFTNPWLRRQWMSFLISDVAGSTCVSETVRKAADRILSLVMSYHGTLESSVPQ